MENIMGNTLELIIPGICGLPEGLSFALDGFRLLYAGIATFMWVVSLILSLEYMKHYERKTRYYFFFALTYIATLGVFVSGDLFTMFVFFEIMSLSSYVWVAFDERKASLRAADTYLAVSVIGGLVMLMGLFLIYDSAKTFVPAPSGSLLRLDGLRYLYLIALSMPWEGGSFKIFAGGLCMLFGFGAKAGAFPLHIWLPKAHPVAPAPASALLSGILTKTGILGILMLSEYIFAGDGRWHAIILIIGLCTMVIGALAALFSADIKETLACSSVSQIGFIMTGIGAAGLGGETGLSGAFLHMVGHSMFKLILFSCAGVIYMNLHRLDLNSIRGFGKGKPLFHAIFLSGALGIAGVPLFNGYISKTLIHEAISEAAHIASISEFTEAGTVLSGTMLYTAEWIFIVSGGCTVAYMLKLYFCLFVEKAAAPDGSISVHNDHNGANTGKRSYMNPLTATALTCAALIPPILGMLPDKIMNRLVKISAGFLGIDIRSEFVLEHYFTFECIKGAFISIGIGVLLYFGVIRLAMKDEQGNYHRVIPTWLDLENAFYRPILLFALPFIGSVFGRMLDTAVDMVILMLRKTLFKDSRRIGEPEEGNRITRALGVLASRIEELYRNAKRKRGRHFGRPTDFAHRFALKYEGFVETRTVIYRSLSFGLMLFALGLVVTVGYILITRWW